jgi:hypothetical protein
MRLGEAHASSKGLEMSKDGKTFISKLIGKRRCPYHEPKLAQNRVGSIPINPDLCNCTKGSDGKER